MNNSAFSDTIWWVTFGIFQQPERAINLARYEEVKTNAAGMSVISPSANSPASPAAAVPAVDENIEAYAW